MGRELAAQGAFVLEMVFRGHSAFVVIALVITAGAGFAAYGLSAKRSDRPVLVGAWVASMVGVAALTLWSTGSSFVPNGCVVNRSVLEQFRTEPGLLNVAMFVPAGVLGVLVTRRFLPAAAAGITLSAVIETAQGAVPALHRACDSSDFLTNSAGAVLGAVCAALALTTIPRRRGPAPWTFPAGRVALGALGVVAVLGAVWGTAIHPHVVTGTTGIAVGAGRFAPQEPGGYSEGSVSRIA